MLVIALGFFIVWGANGAYNSIRNGKQKAKLVEMDAAKSAKMLSANYLPVQPFSGPDFTTAAEKTVHEVVHIRSEFTQKPSLYDDFFGPFRDLFGNPYGYNKPQKIEGFGSGVIISKDGYIVTNNHVVDGSDDVSVTLNDNREFKAKVIGKDPKSDLALIKIDADDLPFITYGNSDDLRLGNWVLAVGNPFNLTGTVTAGIVSAKARDINILGTPGSIESFIQTDAAVNPGNSGGALVNMDGELVGINAAIASNTGSYTGYSFAIPVNIVKKVINDLLNYGEVQRAYLGVTIRELDSKFAQEKGINTSQGIYVESLSDNGGAKDAGIKSGDVISAINATPVNSMAELMEIIGQHKPGDVVDVTVNRKGNNEDYKVELKNVDGTTSIVNKPKESYVKDLGASFQAVPDEVMNKLKIDHGMQVADLQDGLLQRGGVQTGFIILQINNTKISDGQDIDKALKNIKDGIIKIEGIYPNGMKMNYGFIL